MIKKSTFFIGGTLAVAGLLLSVAAYAQTSNIDASVEPTFLKTMYRVASIQKMDMPAPAEAADARKMAQAQRRLKNMHGAAPSELVLREAFAHRDVLQTRALDVRFVLNDGTELGSWNASLVENPSWITLNVTASSASYTVDTLAVQTALHARPWKDVPAPTNATVTGIVDRDGTRLAETSAVAKPGYVFDEATVAKSIADALQKGAPMIQVIVTSAPGKIENATDENLGSLQLLATGRSNFAGSGAGRKHNVRKGLNERMHNLLIAPGETFSFNKALGSLAMSRGWQEALAIFDGWDLRPIPGGGICQVATTLYRAALLSGLNIVERKNHSLYVVYYEKYGVGIDATIFPGKQDFLFQNDTPGYILVQSYTDGDEAYVNIYGTPDGRTVTLEGPYFSKNAPEGIRVKYNDIVWKQSINMPTGDVKENIILSRYSSIPKKLHTQEVTPILLPPGL